MGDPEGRRPRATNHQIAVDHEVDADPASVSHIELGLDTARSATIAPVWAALRQPAAPIDDSDAPSLTVIADHDGN